MVGGEAVSSTARPAGRYVHPVAWDLLGLLGFALFAVGGTDFLLAWFPARFGNPEWEFGTITAALNNMPAPLMGLTLLLVAALQSESVVWSRILSVVMLVWAVVLVGLSVIYALTIPLAAKGFEVPNIGLGLKRAIGKSVVQLVVYPVAMLWMGVRGLKLASSSNT
jgi:hypothetical protein